MVEGLFMDIALPNRFSKEQWDEWRKWHLEKDQYVNEHTDPQIDIKISRLEMQVYKLKLRIDKLERIKSIMDNDNYDSYLRELKS